MPYPADKVIQPLNNWGQYFKLPEKEYIYFLLRHDDGDGNKNATKQKQWLCSCAIHFGHFSVLPSSAKQQREITRRKVMWRTQSIFHFPSQLERSWYQLSSWIVRPDYAVLTSWNSLDLVETTRFRFSSDRFVGVAVVVAFKRPGSDAALHMSRIEF